MIYTIRKNKSKNGHIITFKKEFYDLIKDDDGWVIRVFINTIIKKIREIKNNVSIDFECDKKINEIIKQRSDTIFSDAIIHNICYSFIDGMERSTIKDYNKIYLMIKTFFDKMKG